MDKTNAKTQSEFYNALKGKDLYECNLDSLVEELKEITDNQRKLRESKKNSTFKESKVAINKDFSTFDSDNEAVKEREGYTEDLSDTNMNNIDDMSETNDLPDIYDTDNDCVDVANSDDVDNNEYEVDIDDTFRSSPKSNIDKIRSAKDNEDAMVKVGLITFIIFYLCVQSTFIIPWGLDGFPKDRILFVFIPTIVVVVLYGIITLIDFIRLIKSKGGKKK